MKFKDILDKAYRKTKSIEEWRDTVYNGRHTSFAYGGNMLCLMGGDSVNHVDIKVDQDVKVDGNYIHVTDTQGSNLKLIFYEGIHEGKPYRFYE